MPRKATGQLLWRSTGWYARFWAVVDGERIRVCRALDTTNKVVAARKLDRLLTAESIGSESATRPETFAEAAERVYEERRRDGIGDPDEELASVRRYAYPIIGTMPVVAIDATHVNAVLDHVKAQGRGRQTAQHIKQRVSSVFSRLRRDDNSIKANPVESAVMPMFKESTVKERAVLTDDELAIYLAWEHPVEHRRLAVLERQVMACVARMFGGLRTGDLHALRWEAFDVEGAGAFSWGYAPRQKTRRPQLLEVPELLRPFLRDWWERAGRPGSGVIFPARRSGKRGDRVGQERLGVSHAAAFRRDLQRAFRHALERGVEAPAEGSRRWQELFDETRFTLPVDFHSWRRAFAQALADADVTAQQAIALTGHSDMSVHARYLKSAGKMRRVPENALPQISRSEKAPRKGSADGNAGFGVLQTGSANAKRATMTRHDAPSGALLSRRFWVRIPVGALEFKGLDDPGQNEKAPRMPFPPEATTGVRTRVDVVALLSAIDAALADGNAARARELIAGTLRDLAVDAEPEQLNAE